jgi:hypothetical protein
MQYRYDIQGLRAVAVLLVFFFHLNPNLLSGGFVGVDVFFVISGYLISGIILHKKEQNKFQFVDFYISRFKRILPAYVIFLLVTFLGAIMLYLPSDILGVRNGVFWSSIFYSNKYLSTLDTYFGMSSQENPLLHTWTLAIEMQFYFLLPILLFFIKNKKLLNYVIFLITIVLLGYSFVNSTYLNNKEMMYFSLPARIPEFLIGTLFVMNQEKIQNATKGGRDIISIVSVITILVSSVFFSGNTNFPGLWVLLPCLGAAFLLIDTEGLVSKFLSNKFFVHIGELSYSIYLWHWPVMVFIRYYHNIDNYVFTPLEQFIIIISTYLLAYLSYTFIENTFRKLKTKKFVFTMFVPSGVLGLLMFYAPQLNMKVCGFPQEYAAPTVGKNSHGGYYKEVEFMGDTNKKNDSILLIGDSYALVYKNFLAIVGKKNGFNFRTITNDSYPNLSGISEKDFSSNHLKYRYENLVEITNKELKNSKVVIIGSIYRKNITSLPEAIEKFVKNNPDKKFIFIAPFPKLNKNPIRINRGYKMDKNKDNHYNVSYQEIPESVKRIINNNSNAYMISIDFHKLKGLPFRKGITMYYDEDHMNEYGTTILANEFGDEFYKELKSIIEK